MMKWLLITTVTGSIGSFLLILFKRTLVKRFGGTWYYYACLAILLLFVLPVRFPVTVDIFPKVLSYVEEPLTSSINTELISLEPADRATNIAASEGIAETAPLDNRVFSVPSPAGSVIIIWMCGVLFMLLRYGFSYFRFKHKVIQNDPIDKAGPLDVFLSDYVHSPMLIGFFKPVIVMPRVKISREDYNLALLHELNHYKQGDAWMKLFAAGINSLHWFNPVSYLVAANLSEACEYSCDEKVTKHMQMAEKKYYSEMIVRFASHVAPALSSSLVRSKKQLYRRFDLILSTRPGNRRYLGTLMALFMIVASITATSLVFAEAPQPLAEHHGAMKTYYNIYQTLEENVRNTLGIKLSTDKTQIRVTDRPFYIDVTGRKVDLFNRTEAYYRISRQWKPKDTIGDTFTKTLSIEGKAVTVSFAEEVLPYKDDPIIEQMIRNQITFEINYQNEKNPYDHQAFIEELVKQGVYAIEEVVPQEEFQFDYWNKSNGDQIGMKPLTSYDKKTKIADVFNNKTELFKNIDGQQGTQLGESFVIKQGETLAIDIKETTDAMPTINWAIVNATTGETVDWRPNAPSGYRYIFTPGPSSANHTFKVVMSGEDNGSANIEIFTYKEAAE